jgi:two-component system NtrC family sensor kinase
VEAIIKTLQRFLNLPLRVKLILSFTAVILFGGLLTLTLGTRLEHRTIFDLAQAKVRHDLASAWMVYNEKLSHLKDIVRLNSIRESLQQALVRNDRNLLRRYLDRVRIDFELDILTLTDANGRVAYRSTLPDVWGDDQSGNPLVREALNGDVASGTQIFSRQELLQESRLLAEQAYLPFIPTPMAIPRQEDHEENGMMLQASAPLIDDTGQILGVLYTGILLNRNPEIVDRVKDIVFRGEKYKGREIGTVTIFQQDLRITTNVKNTNGQRAIGTRVSREVNQGVLQEGKPWIGRAFVVNDWYITAYEPIKDIRGKIIGILYVGMLEKPYIDLRNRVMLTFAGMAFLSVIGLLVMLFFITSTIIQPLKQMVLATTKIARGDLDHRVEVAFKDETGQLAQSFNQMTQNLKKANEKLVHWGKTLEKRVEERTMELREMQASMIQSEKLASLGKMAAGIAHEINNPLTSILINTHLMLEKTEKGQNFYENLSLISEETSRCSEIVRGMLEFSRQSPPQKVITNVNEILLRTLQLLENQVSFQNIKIEKRLDGKLPSIELDRNKIKQVFWNLMLNAAEAMPEGGTLTLSSRHFQDKKSIEIEFRDTGLGIEKKHINKLFDPFYSTKTSGTGLGLAVSYGIINQHQGKISVESQLGRGTTFTIILPVSPQKTAVKEER